MRIDGGRRQMLRGYCTFLMPYQLGGWVAPVACEVLVSAADGSGDS
jgi:hypothetical protein